MFSLMLSIWDDFSEWVSTKWSQPVFFLVIAFLGIFGVMGILGFLKGNKFDKDKKPFRWSSLVMSVICFAVMAVLCMAKF